MASSPADAGRGRALPGLEGYFRRKAAMHPSGGALDAASSPCRGAFCARLLREAGGRREWERGTGGCAPAKCGAGGCLEKRNRSKN